MLTKEGSPPCLVSIMEDLEYAETSGPIVRTLFSTALLHKRRAISARPQFWVLQEIGNIGAWPLADPFHSKPGTVEIATLFGQ